jgi:hypothetical protein
MQKIRAVDERREQLTVFDALKYFGDYASDLKPSSPPLYPKAGEIFMYLIDNAGCKGKVAQGWPMLLYKYLLCLNITSFTLCTCIPSARMQPRGEGSSFSQRGI